MMRKTLRKFQFQNNCQRNAEAEILRTQDMFYKINTSQLKIFNKISQTPIDNHPVPLLRSVSDPIGRHRLHLVFLGRIGSFLVVFCKIVQFLLGIRYDSICPRLPSRWTHLAVFVRILKRLHQTQRLVD